MIKRIFQRPIVFLLILLLFSGLSFVFYWMNKAFRSVENENALFVGQLTKEIAEVIKGAPSFALLAEQWPNPESSIRERLKTYLEEICYSYDVEDVAIFGWNNHNELVCLNKGSEHTEKFMLWLRDLVPEIRFNDSNGSRNSWASSDGYFYAIPLKTSVAADFPVFLAIHANSNISGHSDRNLIRWVPFMIVFVFLLIILVLWLAFEIRKKANTQSFLVESLLVILSGILLATAVWIVFDYKMHADEVRLFRSFSENRLHNFRIALNGIRSELALTQAFFDGSEEVTEQELKLFTSTFTRVKNYYEAFFVVQVPKKNTVQGADQQLLPEIVLSSRIEGRGCSRRDPALGKNITEAVLSASADSLFHAVVVGDVHMDGKFKNCLVVALPVSHNPDRKRTGEKYVLLAFINPQLLMDAIMSDGNSFSDILPVGLAYAQNHDLDSVKWVASFPADHISFHEGKSVNQHLKEYELSLRLPLFFSGQIFYLITHDTPQFRKSIATGDLSFAVGSILFFTLLLTMLVYQLRNYYTSLENEVNTRTAHLRLKIKELEIIKGLNGRLTEGSDIRSALAWVCQNYNSGDNLFERPLLYIEYEGKAVCEDLKELTRAYQTLGHSDISKQGKVVGRLELFAGQHFRADDDKQELFMQQLGFTINSWIEFVSTKQKLSEVEERFSRLLESSFDGVYIVENERFVYVNPAFAELVEYSREELTSEDFDLNVLLTPQSREIVKLRREMRARGETPPYRFDFQQLTKSGKVIDVELGLVTVDYSGRNLVFGIVRDVTERRKLERDLYDSEERLQQQNEELQLMNEELLTSNNQMRELNLALSEAHRRAEAGDKLKTAFLNNISHEVRTPLNGICGAAEILANPYLELTEKKEMIEILNVSTRRLLRTITQYMDISLLESGNMPVVMGEIQLTQLLYPVIEEFEVLCKRKGLTFRVENKAGDITLTTDKSLVQKCLSHLLDNAVKFTGKGTIGLSTQIINDQLQIEVTDTGIGISRQFHPQVFDLFMQEDYSDRRKYDGSGLGLPIVKRITRLLGGNVSFESEQGRGSTFQLSIPLKKSSSISTESTARSVHAGPLHILIAEDEDSNYLVLKLLLERKLKAVITRAVNGEQAVDLVRKSPDITMVLMDIKMPLMDGYEATKIIKALNPKVHVIAITAYGLSGDEQRALDAGCDEYIAKPVQASVLFRKIGKLTGVDYQV